MRRLMLVLALAVGLTTACGGSEKKEPAKANFKALPSVTLPAPEECLSCSVQEYRKVVPGTIFVSPTGNDTAAGTQAAPLKTINKAAVVAQCGQWIEVLPGDYVKQTISQDTTKSCTNNPVVVYGQEHLSFGTDPKIKQLTINGDNLRFYHIDGHNANCLTTTVANPNCWPLVLSGAVNVVVSDCTGFARFFVYQGNQQRIQNCDFGPSYDNHGIIGSNAQGLVVENSVVRDQVWSQACIDIGNTCTSGNHQGCMTMNQLKDSAFIGVRLDNCQDLTMLIKPCFGTDLINIDNVKFENVYFGEFGGPRAVSMTNCTGHSSRNVDFLYSTFSGTISLDPDGQYLNSDIIGALGNFGNCTTFANKGFNMDWNVSTGTACGPHSISEAATLGLDTDGYHLLSSSPARDVIPNPVYHPNGDIDTSATVRPNGASVDAGADEYIP